MNRIYFTWQFRWMVLISKFFLFSFLVFVIFWGFWNALSSSYDCFGSGMSLICSSKAIIRTCDYYVDYSIDDIPARCVSYYWKK